MEGEVHLSPFHLTKSDWVEILFEATKVKPQPLLVSSVAQNSDHLPFNFKPRTLARFISSSSYSHSSSFTFQSIKFGSSSISNRLAQIVSTDD